MYGLTHRRCGQSLATSQLGGAKPIQEASEQPIRSQLHPWEDQPITTQERSACIYIYRQDISMYTSIEPCIWTVYLDVHIYRIYALGVYIYRSVCI